MGILKTVLKSVELKITVALVIIGVIATAVLSPATSVPLEIGLGTGAFVTYLLMGMEHFRKK